METNKIYNENCLDTMGRMPDGFIDLTVTSPPYDNLRDYNGYTFDFEPIAQELYRVTKEGGVVVWVVGDATIKGSETGTSFKQALYFMECGFRLHDTMIYNRQGKFPQSVRYWQDFEYMFVFSKGRPRSFNPIKVESVRKKGDRILARKRGKDGVLVEDTCHKKPTYSTGLKSKSNIWRISAGYMSTTKDKLAHEHPAIFPEQLASDHIKTWSDKCDLVYDPFMGSGTTAKMAHLNGRNWIGSEMSSEFTELSYKRLDPYLRQTRLFADTEATTQ